MPDTSNKTALIINRTALTVLLVIPLLAIANLLAGLPVDELFGLDVPFPIAWLNLTVWGLTNLAGSLAPAALPAIVCGLSFPVLLIITMIRLYAKPRLLYPVTTLVYFLGDLVWENVLFCRSAADNSLSFSVNLYTLTFALDVAVILLLTAYIVRFRRNAKAVREDSNE